MSNNSNVSQEILSSITIFNKYAKYIPHLNRRETWTELCDRNMAMHVKKYPALEEEIKQKYRDYVYTRKVLPSMRSMQFGGAPIELANNRIFNCAYMAARAPEVFSEAMFLLLGGTGLGYSVQSHHVAQLPEVKGTKERKRRFLVGDSIEGWADAIKVLMEAYFYNKVDPDFDYRDIRQKGAKLVTSGGKAPGPDPLRICVENIRTILDGAVLRQLTSSEVHDILCHIADAVLSGGIRRAALIALFSADDMDMLSAKSNLPCTITSISNLSDHNGDFTCDLTHPRGRTIIKLNSSNIQFYNNTKTLPWYCLNPQRGRANNSVVLHREHTTQEQFNEVWKYVEDSKAGEPGIFWTNDFELGTNPCAEISLRDMQFCNLTEINVSSVDTQEELNELSKVATFIGTLQAGYTNFHYLRPEWQDNTEAEALIGVGQTGIGSGRVLSLDLKEAANEVIKENSRVAKLIGINEAARTTTIKPSGTTSLTVGCASGIHAWHAEYYVRRMRVGKNEALYHYMIKEIPDLIEDCKFKPHLEAVMSFPQKAPEGSILRTESPLDTLERVKRYNTEWVRQGHRYGNNYHNVSCTISLKDEEWPLVGEWMWDNRSYYTGISVLPYDGGSYVQAPFEDITETTFDTMMKSLHSINLLNVIEDDDNTSLTDQAACAGGACEIL